MKTINWKDFINGSYKKKKPIKAYSLVFTPMMLVDPTILTVGGIILTIALAEKLIGLSGRYEVADGISDTLKMIFPFVLIGAVIFFLTTNPILNWL